MRSRFEIGSVWGAFADGAILLPLLGALSLRCGFSSAALLSGAGLAYLLCGFYFRVPMSVQPLKSIAVGAVALGAGSVEVRWAAVALAGFCLAVAALPIQRWLRRVPSSIVHGLQGALGIVLIKQGVSQWFVPGMDWVSGGQMAAVAGAIVAIPFILGPAWFGVAAMVSFGYAVFRGDASAAVDLSQADPRLSVVVALALPQMALTMANSVLGTEDVCRRYFGDAASRVTVRALLCSIGCGNILAALAGSLPFCHGAGGVTAHYWGGARTWLSNLTIGSVLLALALFQFATGRLQIAYPAPLLAGFLATVGILHLRLAAPTWKSLRGKIKLLSMFGVAAVTGNLLWVLTLGALLELAEYRLPVQVRPRIQY